jgi:hypothetical protein
METALNDIDNEISHSAIFTDIHSIEAQINQQMSRNPNRTELLTSINMDKTYVLTYLINNEYFTWQELLSEVQLSFLLFILLYSHSALNHWKKLISIICQSEKFVLSQTKFTIPFLRILYEQLNFVPSDFFTSEISKDNFLAPALSSLFTSLHQLNVKLSPVRDKLMIENVEENYKRLLKFVQKKFDIFMMESTSDNNHFNDAFLFDEDDMPIILDESELYNQDTESTNTLRIENMEENDQLKFSTPSSLEYQNLMYSWRYPNLYEEMTKSDGREDLLMTASRILEEHRQKKLNQLDIVQDINSNNNKMTMMIKESYLFIENETSYLK